ncbi:sodium/solute symporter [Pedobacter sp. SYP-B3415]|uniref:sodium:solute symporter family transporter n=1 Tax=Pedobacter sp. SYP-B3415 TaxID=2496641 RepID=UPI00101CC91E|nr:sodium/solute symporter [Pedobacter sp. SYP-B3415]
MNLLTTRDYVVFALYFIIISVYGILIYRTKKTRHSDTKAFFLAEGSLTWWAIGASVIASNISAEHFIGMSGSGFAMGLAIASYEWMAAATLIIVAVFFLPVYLRNGIYTMPQFLARRYNDAVSTLMAVFWLLVYVFVNLTSIFFLGALAIESLTGLSFNLCVAGLAVFAVFITLGGMKVIGYTDAVQVLILILGGLVTCYMALDIISDHFSLDGVVPALFKLRSQADNHFHMIFSPGDKFYDDLPGMAVLAGGLWINNLNYWGCNQYIIQRALGADLKTGRNGLIFAAFLKLLIPVIVVIPGICAYVLFKEGYFQNELTGSGGHVKPDRAYPVLMSLLPSGLKGLAFAALTAAVVASLAGKCNSISTIFTLDIYKKYINREASERKMINVGRWATIIASLIAVIIAPALQRFDQVYQFIQEYVGFISPGVFAIFLLGLFWKRTTSAAALVAALSTIPLSMIMKFLPELSSGYFAPIPFLHRMTWVFGFIIAIMVIMTLAAKPRASVAEIVVDKGMFRVNTGFILSSVIILGILTGLYIAFW